MWDERKTPLKKLRREVRSTPRGRLTINVCRSKGLKYVRNIVALGKGMTQDGWWPWNKYQSFFGMSRALSLLIFSNEASLIFPLDIDCCPRTVGYNRHIWSRKFISRSGNELRALNTTEATDDRV